MNGALLSKTQKEVNKMVNGEIGVTVVKMQYSIDESQPCKHDHGTISTCGFRKDGRDYPLCSYEKDAGGFCTRCPQVILKGNTGIPWVDAALEGKPLQKGLKLI